MLNYALKVTALHTIHKHSILPGTTARGPPVAPFTDEGAALNELLPPGSLLFLATPLVGPSQMVSQGGLAQMQGLGAAVG